MFASDGVYEWSVFVMDSLFSLESKTEGRVAIFLETFIRLLLSDTKMVYGELVLKGFIVSVQNHLNLLNQLHNAISFLNFGLFFFLA